MNFRPTKLKIIILIIVIIAWYAFILLLPKNICQCACQEPPSCSEVFVLNIIPVGMPCSDCCTCISATPISKIFKDLLIVLIPGILTYVIWSLAEKKNKIRKK